MQSGIERMGIERCKRFQFIRAKRAEASAKAWISVARQSLCSNPTKLNPHNSENQS
jgi:hypothetical protein